MTMLETFLVALIVIACIALAVGSYIVEARYGNDGNDWIDTDKRDGSRTW